MLVLHLNIIKMAQKGMAVNNVTSSDFLCYRICLVKCDQTFSLTRISFIKSVLDAMLLLHPLVQPLVVGQNSSVL